MNHPKLDKLALLTDHHRLRQIIYNLIENSYKFTNSGFIEFGYTLRKEEILFYVLDTGIGIPEKHHSSIFDRFRQVDGSQNRNFGGTGLGLAITRNLVELLGGEIWIDSTENEGSTFYFTIPLEQVELTEEAEKPSENKQNFDWKNKRILVAEDVDANFNLIKAALRNTKAEIFWAKNGKEAVEMCEKIDQLDVVLMDINMPEMNGYEATKCIKEKYANLPVIGQTAYAMVGEAEKCKENGFDAYVSKPIKIDNLMNLIDDCLV